MKVEVHCINRQGRPLPKSQRLSQPVCRGELKVFENRLHALNRVVRCARLVSLTDGLESELLPELTDAQLLWVDDRKMRFSGIETVDGTFYQQSWDVKVL